MKRESAFWGVLFILASIFIVISRLGYLPGVNAISLILTVFLATIIAKSIGHLNFSGILFPIAFICIIYDKELGITAITPWTVLLAALFGSIGLSMIFHKQMKWVHRNHHKHHDEDYTFEKIDIEDESNVMFKTAFGASIKYINTDSFEKGNFECSFGAMKIYFDNAVMSHKSAVVRIDASFSGIELYVPKDWKVDDKTSVFLGGVSEKNRSNDSAMHTLTLVGDVSFSGIEIIYV
jgi:predicted membrane protein